MYARYPNTRQGGRVKLPENYSGNAFITSEREKNEEEPPRVASDGGDSVEKDKSDSAEVSLVGKEEKKPKAPTFGFDALRLFSGGFGFEELLLVALIILISQGEGDDELVLLLALLLFVR